MGVSRGLMLMEGSLTLVVVVVMCCCFGLMEASHVVYENLETNRSSFTEGQYRTGYHFQPPMHWINDPNGPMYYNGIYHLFYQYNPLGAVWGNIVWAHSVSTDMVNWIPLEPAIYPSKWFDINGCWSGSATIIPGKGPVIMYTGIGPNNRQLQNIAVPKDLSDRFLREWVKPDYNPVIDADSSINATAFRDPTTAWLGPDGLWRLVIGSRKLGRDRGLAVLYKSKDFIHWTKAKHPLHSVGEGIGMWECPDFFPVALEGKNGIDTSEIGDGVKHVFKVSLDLTRFEYYTVGKYILKGDVYVPDNTSADNASGLRLDYGNFYASKTFFDAGKNRRILWGWSNESDTKWDDTSKGWAGIQTIPRSLWLDTTGRQVVQWPIQELESLRGAQVDIQGRNLNSGEILAISGIQTAQTDVEVTFDVPSLHKAEAFDPSWTDPQALCVLKGAEVQGGVGPFGLLVLASNDLEERTAVFFRVFKTSKKYVVLMCHDTSRSSLRTEVWKQSFGGFVDVDIEKEKKISLRSLVDHSVVESFGAEGRTCMTSRVYPILATHSGTNMLAFNSGLQGITISNLTAWEMHSPLMNQS